MSKSISQIERNVETVNAFNDLVFGEHDLSRMDEFMADDVVQFDGQTETEGIEAARAYFEGMLETYPDVSLTTHRIVADDDSVMFHCELTGTNEGDIETLEGDVVSATGETATWQAMVAAEMVDGKMAKVDVVSDRLSAWKQLGIVEHLAA